MKSRQRSFNIFFALVCLVLAGGCASDKASQDKKAHKKEQSTIRLYLEGQKTDSVTSGTVLVTRSKIPYTIERDAFLDESDINNASLIDDPSGDGSFYIQLRLKDHGTLLLDMVTSDKKGKHIIVFAQFPQPGHKEAKAKKQHPEDPEGADLETPDQPAQPAKPAKPDKAAKSEPPAANPPARESAWLAAVLIRGRISNGMFRFTPDVSREEGIRIVRGLRNVIAKEKKEDKI